MKRSRRQFEAERNVRKKNRVDCFAYLPDDILVEIFNLLPAELLRYKFKFVCKRWFSLITNRILLDQASLLIQMPTDNDQQLYRTRLVDIHEGELPLKMKEQYLDLPCEGRIKSWCNELLLITDPLRHGLLYVFNLITKEGFSLPSCSSTCNGHVGCKCGLGLAFDQFKGVYKVVHVFVGPQSVQCEILSFRNLSSASDGSKWKKINGPYYMGQRKYYWDDPVSVQGRYFHWDVHSSKYIVSMDIVKERFRQTRLPESVTSSKRNTYYLMEMGSFLSLLHAGSSTEVDVWLLKDFQRSVWKKLKSIRILSYSGSTLYPGNIYPLPITSLKNKSNLIFRKFGTEIGLFGYNMKSDLMEKLNIQVTAEERCVVQSTALDFD